MGREHFTVEDSVRELTVPVVDEFGLELVEIQFRREGRGWVLRLIIDCEGGISIDQCAAVSREVGRILEVEEVIDHAYSLEVSSPGLDRPLKRRQDFERFVGRLARVKTSEPVEGLNLLVGRLAGMGSADTVLIEIEKEVVGIPFELIRKARLEVDF